MKNVCKMLFPQLNNIYFKNNTLNVITIEMPSEESIAVISCRLTKMGNNMQRIVRNLVIYGNLQG